MSCENTVRPWFMRHPRLKTGRTMASQPFKLKSVTPHDQHNFK
jgi:hypothetical protein